MRKIARRLLLVCLVLLSGPLYALSDISLSMLAQKGKHHELIDTIAPAVKEGSVSSFQLLLLSGSYYEVGKYRQALETADLFDKRISGGDRSMFGADLSVYPAIIRGLVALDQGLLDEAVRHGTLADGQLKPNQFFYRSQLIMVGTILGVAHALTGKPGLAREHLERIRAIDIGGSNLGPEKFTALARIQVALKDYAGALTSISDPNANVSPILTIFYDPTFQNVPRFFMRAKSLLETAQIAEAKRDYDELLKHPQIAQYGSLYWIVLQDRARIAIIENDLPAARDLLFRAIEVIEQRRSSISTDAGRIGFVGDKQEAYGQLVRILLQLGDAQAAFDVTERAKSRALVDLLAAKTDFAVRGADAGRVRSVLAEIDAIDQTLHEKQADVPGTEVKGLRSMRDARQRLAETAPQLASLVSVATTPVGELAGLMAPEDALVEYYYSGKDLYAFVLKQGKVQAVVLDRGSLEQDILALRGKIEAASGTEWQVLSERLYLQIWQPIESLVSGSRRLLIVAHGALHYLPFSALCGPDGKLLVERYGLSFLPSASVLRFLAAPSAETGASMLVLGNPDLDDPSMDLKFAGEEALVVSKAYPDARLLLRRDASETNFRNAGQAFKRLHIASHGSFRADAPLSSGLHLAKDGTNDGLLTVSELYGIDLNADLVTLSACETGLGKVSSGDDVVGLVRGFLYAGAKSIVSSLWNVDDKATGLLMQHFYRNVAQRDNVEALRRAQQSIRLQFPHPFFWAAFQHTGSLR